MTVVISMLRGVNVGSHNRIKMEALRDLYTSLGFRDPQTYVQSGNVLFKTRERDLTQTAKRIEDGIERTFGFRADAILRTPAELRRVIAANPFATRTGIDPSRLLVTFFANEPAAECCNNLLSINADPEELRIAGREVYLYFPSGIARAKLTHALVERTLKIPGTGRNWNSVTKMLELAEEFESSR